MRFYYHLVASVMVFFETYFDTHNDHRSRMEGFYYLDFESSVHSQKLVDQYVDPKLFELVEDHRGDGVAVLRFDMIEMPEGHNSLSVVVLKFDEAGSLVLRGATGAYLDEVTRWIVGQWSIPETR